jgi:mannan endo-1,4-beta-mannosidase
MQRKLLGLLLLGLMLATLFNLVTINAAPAGFVYASGADFMLDGKVFRFGGANNYYLHYKSTLMIDDVLNDAVAMNLKVIRCWAFMNGDGQENIVMQPSLGEFNDAGFVRLDYTIQKAEELGLKLILPLVNNWDDFGGMNQYVKWTGAGSHDAFYTNEDCKKAYKNYIKYVINRTNSYTGQKYKDSPAIFAWELANEPRCQTDATGDTLVKWADEMSAYIKSLDSDHLVSVGDEGFLNRAGATDWFYNGGEGVDWDRLTALENIDFGTVHLYPGHWGKTVDWGDQWIKDHTDSGKPVVLEEFGSYGDKETAYQSWCDTALSSGYAGTMFWILTGIQDDGQLYADYDGFRVVYPSDVATVLMEHAVQMAAGNGTVTTSPTNTATLVPTATVTTTLTATGTPVTTATATPTPAAPTSTEFCVVNYAQYDWGDGATVSITIKNNCAIAINAWELAFSFAGDQKIVNLWNGAYTQSGVDVTVTNMSYNSSLPAGGTVSFGFNISYSGANDPPTVFLLNDSLCSTY